MKRRQFINAAAACCFTPLVFTLVMKPEVPLPLPLKYRVTVELQQDGIVREIRHTDFRTFEEARTYFGHGAVVPLLSGMTASYTLNRL